MGINTIYTIGLIILWILFGLAFAWWVFFVSLLLALVPLAMSKFWFALPILILIWAFFISDSPVYNSTFGWLCLAYVPFHYFAFAGNVIGAIKGFWDID